MFVVFVVVVKPVRKILVLVFVAVAVWVVKS